MLPIRIAASTLISLLLASCVHLIEPHETSYPIGWAPLGGEGHAGNSCPNIAGVYSDLGQFESSIRWGGQCGHDGSTNCQSLTYSLLYDYLDKHTGTTFLWRENAAFWPTHVRIEQPSPDVVEIHDFTNPDEKKKILSLSSGDFTCDSDGLTVKKTTIRTLVIYNDTDFETRTFNRADDGSLVMHSMWRYVAHYFFIPFMRKAEGWARWERSDLVKPTTVELPPHENLLDCVKRGTGKCDDYVSCFSGGKRQWTNRSKCD